MLDLEKQNISPLTQRRSKIHGRRRHPSHDKYHAETSEELQEKIEKGLRIYKTS
tara:strand:- start:764 stop:925 length:162 start_codon:yes stop_codon:yes gene_type:complete